MKVLIIFNPVSGSKVLHYSKQQVCKILDGEDIKYTWFETLPEPVQPLEQFKGQGFDRIVVFGGDGTVRDTAQFLVEHAMHIPMGIVAQGTGNIVAVSLGIPIFPLKRAIQFALYTEPKPFDVMKINNRYIALLAVGQGYDSIFIHGATRKLKRQFGLLAYLISFIKTFITYRHRQYSISVDGTEHVTKGKIAIIFNILSIQGIPVSKDIHPADGKVNMAICDPRSLWDFLAILGHYLVLRAWPHKRYQLFTGKDIRITQVGGKEIQIDGEVFPESEAHVTVVPDSLYIAYAKNF